MVLGEGVVYGVVWDVVGWWGVVVGGVRVCKCACTYVCFEMCKCPFGFLTVLSVTQNKKRSPAHFHL